ncbi:MAG: transglycosylase SLT domain-containing protein [Clostridiales bacterium]|nr:transglycosylase SLT domain-containing protein [Clostridiales bacterium]
MKNRNISIATIFFALLLTVVIAQNLYLINEIKNLNIDNESLNEQLSQIGTLNKEISYLEDENFIIRRVLVEEKEVADNYRNLVGDYQSNDLVAKAKEIENSTPLDFETAYIIAKYSDQMDLNVSLILSVMELESNFSQYEVGTSDDRGYMQIIPDTEKWLAEEFGSELGLEYDPERIFEPEYNIGLASIYLSLLQNTYGNDYDRILSEYNRGPYNLKKYYEENNTYETTYSKVILSKESKYLALND